MFILIICSLFSCASGSRSSDPSAHHRPLQEQGPGDLHQTGWALYPVRHNEVDPVLFFKEPGKQHAPGLCASVQKIGGEELQRRGGLEAFKPGFTFYDAGGTEALYNDHTDMYTVTDKGNLLHITPNVVIKESTYTLGITGDYLMILHSANRIKEILLRDGFDLDSIISKNIKF